MSDLIKFAFVCSTFSSLPSLVGLNHLLFEIDVVILVQIESCSRYLNGVCLSDRSPFIDEMSIFMCFLVNLSDIDVCLVWLVIVRQRMTLVISDADCLTQLMNLTVFVLVNYC